MSKLNEIDYGVLIDRSIQDFRPVKRIWPVNIRLLLWILLEAVILALSVLFNGRLDAVAAVPLHNYGFEAAGFVLISIAAAWMALRNSIPGRESRATELISLAVGVIAAALMVRFEPLNGVPLLSHDFHSMLGRQWTFAALPWLALFWAARRAMPLRPWLVGGMIGVAAWCFAIAVQLFSGPAYPIIWGLLAGAILTVLSVIAGAVWLDSRRLWRIDSGLSTDRPDESAWLEARVIFPLAAALAAGLLLFVLKAGTGTNGPVPDFDLAIENYQQSLANFRPNVPSNSLETVLTAYIEHGMPSYMWDFGPQGFKLLGGRFEHLADGTPVTYTWFRSAKTGVMCMFRQVNGFEVPPANHSESHHLLFYSYRGYSVCLINVGGYGDFISVIVSPIPMKPFMRVVFGALSIEER
jgi:Negative regulator of sigma F